MGKQHILFQSTLLKQEVSQVLCNSNIHQVPELKKTRISSVVMFPGNLKSLLFNLSSLQLILNLKGFVILTRKSNASVKFQKGQPLGSRITLNKRRSFLFLQFLILNLFPKMNLTNFFKVNKKELNLKFSLNFSRMFKRIFPLYVFYQENSKIQINFQCSGDKEKKVIFWRFLKLPLN